LTCGLAAVLPGGGGRPRTEEATADATPKTQLETCVPLDQ
jgi:hypothetical protein